MSASVDSTQAVAFVPGERPRPDWLRSHPRAWLAAVATVCFGAFMGQLDASVVALTYHRIGNDFGTTLTVVQWVGLTYLIALALLLVPAGALSDRLGRKRVYLWGFLLFGLSSLACSLAPNLATLDVLRAVQGVSAAMLQANSVALVTTSVPREKMRTALGIQAAAQAIGLALGPTLGGVIVADVGWRWVFAINVPIAIVGMLTGRYLLPRTRVSVKRRVMSPAAEARSVWNTPRMPGRLLGALLGYLLLFGPIVLVPSVLQDRGHSSTIAGLIVATIAVGFALAAGTAERVLPKAWSADRRCAAGLMISATGLLVLFGGGTATASLVVGLLLTGCGVGIFAPANNSLIMASVSPFVAGTAGGMVNTARALGTAGGTAVVALAIMQWHALRPAVVVLFGVALAAAATLPQRRRSRQ